MAATKRWPASMRLLSTSKGSTSPAKWLPRPSKSDASRNDSQEPMSLQPKSTGSTAARAVRSITATSKEALGLRRNASPRTKEVEVRLALLNRFGHGSRHLGVVRLDLRQSDFCVNQEHAAVPKMATGGHEGSGALRVRFFDEGVDRLNTPLARRFQRDVAVAGLRSGWHNAEGHHRAVLARDLGGLDRRDKALGVFDPVVRGQRQQLGTGGFGNGQTGSQRDGRRGVAALRLQGYALPRQIQGPKLLSDQKAVGLVADDNRRPISNRRRPQHGVLQQGSLAEQSMKRLGEQRSRPRPQAAADATGQHHGDEGLQGRRRLLIGGGPNRTRGSISA